MRAIVQVQLGIVQNQTRYFLSKFEYESSKKKKKNGDEE